LNETLLEYVAPVRGGTRRDLCLAAMKYLSKVDGSGITAPELKAALVAARVPKAKQFNVADVLGKSADLVEVNREGKMNEWKLTESGEKYVCDLLGLETGSVQPEVQNSVAGLVKLLDSLADEVIKSYVEESLTCFQVDAERASVVFLWSGAIRHMQDRAFALGIQPLNLAIVKHDQRVKVISKIEDFSGVKDVTQLLAFRDLGLIDKGQWQSLQEGLDLRNRCGHPTKYRPGPSKVAAFIEDIVGIVF
jgi:hypothetical protein